MTSRSDTGEERLQHESRISPSTTQIDGVQTAGAFDTYFESARQREDEEATSGPADQPLQHMPCSSRSETHQDEPSEEWVITGIRVADVAHGLRRIPAGFYTVVHHSGVEWRTGNKRSSVNKDVVEWSGPIPIPSDLSTTICLNVYASFEFQSMLGAGEHLRELATTVEQLLDRSATRVPFFLFPKAEDVVSPCSSILVTVERQKCDNNDSLTLSHRSTTKSPGELENATNLGHSAVSCYQRNGEKRDLERSIKEFERALRICPVDHPCRAAAQSNLAMAKFILYQVEGTDAFLEDPLRLYRDALVSRPVGHLDRPSTLIQLAIVHFARFEKRRDEGEGARGEALLREVIGLGSTESHENQAAIFMLQLHAGRKVGSFQVDGQLSMNQDPASRFADENLLTFGVRLIHRFERFGALADLQQAIVLLRILLRSTSASSDRYREGMVNLGMALRYQFNYVGELGDLEEAISTHRNAIDLTPHGHPDKPTVVGNLANSLVTRFNYLGEPHDLEEAILRHRDAVDLTSHSHPDKPMCLSNLGGSLLTRFRRFGLLSDFEEAISRFRDAVNLTPHGDPEKPSRLSNLASSLVTRFERLGEMGDLEDAISMLRVAVNLTPHGYVHKPTFLTSLGNSLATRFEHLGELSDLEEVIQRYRDAVDLIPHGHPYKLTCLGNLGNSLFTRFKHLGDAGDLEEAISRFRDTVDFTPHGHPDKPDRLNNFGNSLKARFRCYGELSDLEHAISMLRDALNLTSHGDPCRPIYLNSLGNSLKARFEFFEDPSDLEDAISMLGDAIDLTPFGPKKPHFLNNLGNAFITRFERLGELSDLEDAISRYRDAVELAPHGHLDRPYCLYNLGISLDARFKRLGQPNDPEEAISLFLLAVSASTSPIRVRFYASQSWISCARRIRHHSLLHSYSVYINLLHQRAWIGLPFAHRCSRLIQVADVVREAAAAALDSGLAETAVEWLERGRSIVWGELFQLRSSYEELSSAHPSHAHRLRELSAALEHASIRHEKAWPSPSEQNQSMAHHTTEPLKQAIADRQRMLAIERDELLQKIRSFPGFEQFLLRKEFSQLRASAHSGPVVVLNAAKSRCDALIILANVDHVIHVPLPRFPFKRAAGLQKMLEKLLGHARAVLCDDRKGDPAIRYCISWESLLSNLWNDVVIPVLDALAFSTPEELSRIFWCPTGPFVFLPIHAAGIYGIQHSKPGHKVSDFVISSYVPTLSSLMLPRNPDVAPSGDLRLLAVRQPPSDGLSQLPGVATELEHIKAVIRSSPLARTTLLESSVGTVEEVLSLMKMADWVHFACHGIQDDVDSGLCLADRRRLKLRDIIALSRPRGGLAFLSACQTATGDERLSDEAIHIAAGMLFAGYGGVIGTMWSINDKLAPGVARDVYEQLFRNGTTPDYREAARALHEAIRRLRDSGQASFVTWLPFIHVGL